MAGYSATLLAKKLGIKPGYTVRLINTPEYYFDYFTDRPAEVNVLTGAGSKKNLIHIFVKQMKELEKDILKLKNEIEQDGMIWVSWYKKRQEFQLMLQKIRSALLHWQMDLWM